MRHIVRLIQTERELRSKLAAGELSSGEEQARLEAAEEALKKTSARNCCGSAGPGASSERYPGAAASPSRLRGQRYVQ